MTTPRDPDRLAVNGPMTRVAPDVYRRVMRHAGAMQADTARPSGRVTFSDAIRDLLDRNDGIAGAAS